MSRTVSWLHLSDLHVCKPISGWDAERVIDTLLDDLTVLRQKGVQPDLLFFTGDLAFGHINEEEGKSIADQFQDGEAFLTKVRNRFDPVIKKSQTFIVPGNHDVNRTSIPDEITKELYGMSIRDVNNMIRDTTPTWSAIISRLDEYKKFLLENGYDHCLKDQDRIVYSHTSEVAGVRIGIAGFNSTWSSTGSGPSERGQLWAAGRYQSETLQSKIKSCEFKIALIHHPGGWLVTHEDPPFFRDLGEDFHFVLHGHEHLQFVEQNSKGHSVISAGACHEWSDSGRNGYSYTKIDLDGQRGVVWLRKYDDTGRGWVPRLVSGKTDDFGVWHLERLSSWLDPLGLAPPLESLLPSSDRESNDNALPRGRRHRRPSTSFSNVLPGSSDPSPNPTSIDASGAVAPVMAPSLFRPNLTRPVIKAKSKTA